MMVLLILMVTLITVSLVFLRLFSLALALSTRDSPWRKKFSRMGLTLAVMGVAGVAAASLTRHRRNV